MHQRQPSLAHLGCLGEAWKARQTVFTHESHRVLRVPLDNVWIVPDDWSNVVDRDVPMTLEQAPANVDDRRRLDRLDEKWHDRICRSSGTFAMALEEGSSVRGWLAGHDFTHCNGGCRINGLMRFCNASRLH